MRRGRRALAAACLLTFLVCGCTPATPAPSPTPSATTPTETSQEREERLAYEAAEQSYRAFRVEFNRVLTEGGASRATTTMTRTAGGNYLKQNLDVVKAYDGFHYHQEGDDKIIFVRQNGYSPTSVLLQTCEDASGVRIIGKDGKLIGKGDVRTLDLEVRNVTGAWKVWSGRGDKVSSCDE